MYWRVKTWEIIITDYFPFFDETYTKTLQFQRFYDNYIVTSEEQLVCGLNLTTTLDPDNMRFWDFYINPSFNNFSSYSLRSAASFALAEGNDRGTQMGEPSFDMPNPEPYTVNIENFGSDTASATFYRNSADEFEAYVTARVIALDYWSYGGTYDTTTGEPL